MIDKLFALIAAAGFAAFCGVLIVYVPHPDLVTVIILVLLMTCYDFIRDLFFHRDGR